MSSAQVCVIPTAIPRRFEASVWGLWVQGDLLAIFGHLSLNS